MTMRGNLECLQYFNFETDFMEYENLFQNTGVPFFSWSTKIENASPSCKTTISEVNVKTNRMVSTKWTKEQCFASNYSIFSKILFQVVRASYKELT